MASLQSQTSCVLYICTFIQCKLGLSALSAVERSYMNELIKDWLMYVSDVLFTLKNVVKPTVFEEASEEVTKCSQNEPTMIQ